MHLGLTEEQITLVKTLNEKHGLGVKSICRKTNFPNSVVREVLGVRGTMGGKPSMTNEQIEEIVCMYNKDIPLHEIGTKFKKHYYTIKSALISRGVELKGQKRGKPFSNEEESEIVRRYESGESVDSIRKSFKCSHKPILRVLYAHEVEIRDRGNISKRRTYRSFKIPSSTFSAKKSSADKRGLCWEISQKDVSDLFEKQKGLCAYTGLSMVFSGDPYEYSKIAAENPYAISIDRKDSLLGYTVDNIVLCCRFVNYAKNLFSEKQFKEVLLKASLSIASSPELQIFLNK